MEIWHNYILIILKYSALEREPSEVSPCSNCGPNSICINEQCHCAPGYLGSPPFCRYECLGSNDCGWELTCINRRCVDPCPGACGQGALCKANAHEPHCDCPPSTTGNPIYECRTIEKSRKIDLTGRNNCFSDVQQYNIFLNV